MTMEIHQEEQSQMINDVIAGKYDAAGWRNHPGYDPDTQYVWWHCGNTPTGALTPTFDKANTCDNLVNFSGFNDPVINKALDDGRSTSDPAVRKAAYEKINQEFADKLWELWGYYVIWGVAYSNHVHGVNVIKLPTADSVKAVGENQFPGYSSGIDPAGVWVDNG
jgi:peptide/nickel transport system substrate-binding protein